MELRIVARLHSRFPGKFGLPRQSGLAPALRGEIVFEPPYRDEQALRGIEGFSHLWLIWQFSENAERGWSPTVRPPRLGGNARMGVFATRAPFRPNPLGLSCVRLEGVERGGKHGPVLLVSGVDMADGTPIYDIKPYLPYADSIPDAAGGFTDSARRTPLKVDIPPVLLERVPPGDRAGLLDALACDPRPAYHDDPERVYALPFAGLTLRFRVRDGRLSVLAADEA